MSPFNYRQKNISENTLKLKPYEDNSFYRFNSACQVIIILFVKFVILINIH